MKNKGWRKEPHRHACATRGVETNNLKSIETPYKIIPTKIKDWSDELLQEQYEENLKDFLMMRRGKISHTDPSWKYVIYTGTAIANEMDKRKLNPIKKLEQIKVEYTKQLGINKEEFDLSGMK
jgi:hypothetical protein